MKPERTFRRSITKHLQLYCWSINDSWATGIPDHYYSGNADDLWAEYKWYAKDPKRFNLTRPPKSPKLTRKQQYWLNSRHDEGRNVWVVVGFPSGGIILRDKEWMEPIDVGTILTRKEIAEEIMKLCQDGTKYQTK